MEVYPAAALVRWSIDPRGYKATTARDARQSIIDQLVANSGGSLVLSREVADACVAIDHALDALICVLVARAAAIDDLADGPPAEALVQAKREGWIWLPRRESLAALAHPAVGD